MGIFVIETSSANIADSRLVHITYCVYEAVRNRFVTVRREGSLFPEGNFCVLAGVTTPTTPGS